MFAQKLKMFPATIVFSAAAMGAVFPTCSYNMEKIKLGKVSSIPNVFRVFRNVDIWF